MNRFLKCLTTFVLLITALQLDAAVTVKNLTVEGMANPLGLDTALPRFSWMTASDKKNTMQTGYQILVASSLDNLNHDKGDVWDSKLVTSDRQLWVPYEGRKLKSGCYLYWKVRVTTNQGNSAWSEPQYFSIGLLSENDWSGRWIGLEGLQQGEQMGMHTRLAARMLRKEFKAKGKISRALAYVAGLGLYTFYINGTRVGKGEALTPSPSDYRKSIYFNTYDVTSLLQADNAVGIVLGNGRFFPMRLEKPYKVTFFGFPKCRINICVTYADGSTETWATDQTWKLTTEGLIRANNEYDGETYDARKEMKGWTQVGFNDGSWQPAQRCALPDGALHGKVMPTMTEQPYGHPMSITKREDCYILDFGQNMAGWVSMNVRGTAGDTLRLKYAERLNADGSLYLDNLRNALSEDIYVCNGTENGRPWRSTFAYHGFRYVAVYGYRNAQASDFMAYTVGDEMAQTGSLTTSDSTLNKVIHNAIWGIKSNYKGMPVDCPQRNERQPWLGDRSAGCLGESFVFNNERLYTKWMRDLTEGQRYDGAMSNVTPAFWNYFEDNMTWPSVFPFACDMLYRQYGNAEAIVNSYAAIKKWLNHMTSEYMHDYIITKDKYGDWCMPPEKLELIHSNDPTRQTDGKLLSTAYGIRIMQLMEQFASMQHLTADSAMWHDTRAKMIEAFNRNFLTCKRGTSLRPGHVLYPDSVFYGNNTATANLVALAFGIVPDSLKAEVVKNVVQNIIVRGNGHITCGIIGTSWLMRGLSDNGFADVAYLLATCSTYPSWGYMAANGATTIWELWNGDKANPAMNSGNHVMLLGDLLTWCWQYLGGIKQQGTAYKHLVLKPSFEIEDLFHVDASYETPYGMVRSKWQKTLQQLSWDVEIPANTTADVFLPNGEVKHIGSGQWHFDSDIPTSSPLIKTDEFLYERAPFPSAHASTVTQLKNGDLVAAYFGGTFERNPDVCIWVSRKPKGAKAWEAPILAADGVFEVGSEDALKAGVTKQTTAAAYGPVKVRKSQELKKYQSQISQWHYDYYNKALNDTTKLSPNLRRLACWNPVLYTMPNGEIWLFYKVGANISGWTGWLVKSKDGGKTWSDREALPKGFLGPIKNKPEIINNRLVCPSSTESDGWRFHVEILDLATGKWKYVGPVDADSCAITDDVEPTTTDMAHPIYKSGKGPKPIYSIQPSILKLADGRLQVLMRTHNGRLAQSFSSDGGDTWSKVTLSDLPSTQSGTDAVTLADGTHVLVYNNFSTLPGTKKGPRTPLDVAISKDGQHWKHVLTLEDSPINQYSYPAVIQGTDGKIHIVYTWRRQRISYKCISLPAE